MLLPLFLLLLCCSCSASFSLFEHQTEVDVGLLLFFVAAFDVVVAAALAAVFVAVDMFAVVPRSSFSSGDAIVTKTERG